MTVTKMKPDQISHMLDMHNLTQCLTCKHYKRTNPYRGMIICVKDGYNAHIGRLGTCQFREVDCEARA